MGLVMLYTVSDPRIILRQQCLELALERASRSRFDFYYRFEQAAIQAIKIVKELLFVRMSTFIAD